METTVKLYGKLKEEFGPEFTFQGVTSILDAVDAMSANFSTFRQAVVKNKEYHVYIDELNVGHEELNLNVEDKTIRIVPVLSVANGSVGKIVLGAVLIGAAFFTAGGSIAAMTALQAGVFKLGIGLVLSGFAELIFSPPTDTPDEDDYKSYLFSGAINIAKEGVPVPIGYGRVRIGSTNISNSLRNYNTSPYGGD